VGAMTIAIKHALIGGIEGHNAGSAVAVLEVVVLAVDTSVDDVDFNASASSTGFHLVGSVSNRAATADRAETNRAGKTPRVRSRVRDAGLESAGDHVGLDVLDIRVSGKRLGFVDGHLDGVSLEVTDRVGVHGVSLVNKRNHGSLVSFHPDILVQDDDVLARDDLRA